MKHAIACYMLLINSFIFCMKYPRDVIPETPNESTAENNKNPSLNDSENHYAFNGLVKNSDNSWLEDVGEGPNSSLLVLEPHYLISGNTITRYYPPFLLGNDIDFDGARTKGLQYRPSPHEFEPPTEEQLRECVKTIPQSPSPQSSFTRKMEPYRLDCTDDRPQKLPEPMSFLYDVDADIDVFPVPSPTYWRDYGDSSPKVYTTPIECLNTKEKLEKLQHASQEEKDNNLRTVFKENDPWPGNTFPYRSSEYHPPLYTEDYPNSDKEYLAIRPSNPPTEEMIRQFRAAYSSPNEKPGRLSEPILHLLPHQHVYRHRAYPLHPDLISIKKHLSPVSNLKISGHLEAQKNLSPEEKDNKLREVMAKLYTLSWTDEFRSEIVACIESGAHYKGLQREFVSLLSRTLLCEDTAMTKYLLEHGADIHPTNIPDDNLLMYAHSIEDINTLIDYGVLDKPYDPNDLLKNAEKQQYSQKVIKYWHDVATYIHVDNDLAAYWNNQLSTDKRIYMENVQ